MKIFAFATIFAATLAAPIDASVDALATNTIAIESVDAIEAAAYTSDEADEDILDYSDDEYEAIFAEVAKMVKDDE